MLSLDQYPKCYSEFSLEEKKKKAKKLFHDFAETYPCSQLMQACQEDFKLCSLVGYRLIAELYDEKNRIHNPDTIASLLGWDKFYHDVPICDPIWVPVRYCGGNMEFGRVFAINHCAFSSKDSIIGFGSSDAICPPNGFKILKGLKHVGSYKGWILFKLDPTTTDDMTGMLYSTLEKNFTIEFAHFPHDASPRILFHWEDS